jgi:hypothetical protein
VEDILGCTKYLMNDPFWQEPGKLKPQSVLEALPEWKNRGKPNTKAAPPPKSNPSSGVVSRADGERQRQIIGR